MSIFFSVGSDVGVSLFSVIEVFTISVSIILSSILEGIELSIELFWVVVGCLSSLLESIFPSSWLREVVGVGGSVITFFIETVCLAEMD